jgi:hypothetical protein
LSWDVLLYSADGTPESLRALEDAVNSADTGLPVIGEAPQLRRSISECAPSVDWSDPTWGILEGEGFSIEFNMGRENSIRDIMLHVRGAGDPISVIVAICKRLRCRALDTITSQCLDLATPSDKGWRDFQDYRDKVLNRYLPD